MLLAWRHSALASSGVVQWRSDSGDVVRCAVAYPERAIAITYRVFVNQENSALPNLALTLTLTLTLTLALALTITLT